MPTSDGPRLARLLLEAFETMLSEVVARLEEQGHPGVTATHAFALRAIDEGSGDAAALGRRLGVSRQAAAKTIAALEQLGYLERVAHARDARRKQLQVTARGHDMTAIGGAAFDAVRERWRSAVGAERAELVEQALEQLRGEPPSRPLP